MFPFRLILTNEILTTFSETHGNGYMKLQYVGVIDELFGYSIGLILFVATVKFLKLLRFNMRFNVLMLTLARCWEVSEICFNRYKYISICSKCPILFEYVTGGFFRTFLDSWQSFSWFLWPLYKYST